MDDAFYIRLVDACFTEGSLFDFDAFVVTVKTGGRPYGVISRQMIRPLQRRWVRVAEGSLWEGGEVVQ